MPYTYLSAPKVSHQPLYLFIIISVCDKNTWYKLYFVNKILSTEHGIVNYRHHTVQ